MIGQFNPFLNLAASQVIFTGGVTTIGLVRSTSPTTEQNNDVLWLANHN